MTEASSRRDQRIVSHIKAIHQAGGDEQAYQKALNAVRDDNLLKEAQREAIYKTLAQQSLLWYLEACTGRAIPFEEIEQKLSAPPAKP